MLDWKTLTIFTHSSLLVIAESRRHGMRVGGRCDHLRDNTWPIHCSFLSISMQLECVGIVKQTKCTLFNIVCIQTMKLNNVTASVNFPFQNLVKVCVCFLHGF